MFLSDFMVDSFPILAALRVPAAIPEKSPPRVPLKPSRIRDYCDGLNADEYRGQQLISTRGRPE